MPVLRLAGASASFNVMDLWIRHRSSWAMTGVRGTPAIVAAALAGPLFLFWASQLPAGPSGPGDWNRTSENED